MAVLNYDAATEHLSINNTFFRRLWILLALKTTARLFKRDVPCYPISKHIIVKTGRFVHLTEAATMRFLSANTNIPVPRVYCSFVYKNKTYIAMERLQGIAIGEAWPLLSETDRAGILEQLKAMMQELRSLTPPSGTAVASCVGGSLRDSRIPRSNPRFGPFPTIQCFHRWLREDFRPEDHPTRVEDQDWRDIKDMIAEQDGNWAPLVFTHGDLNPSNILVQGSQIIGIIDWEFAGWYPFYWEYTSAWYGNRTRPLWQNMLARFLDPCPRELKMEITRQRWWGNI